MKPFLIFLLLLPTMVYGQWPLFCIGGAEFITEPLPRRSGLTCEVTATFTVQDFKPVNVKISNTCPALTQVTEENLRRLIFLRDTVSATLHFHYAHVARGSINTDYAVVKSDSELYLTFRQEAVYPAGQDPGCSVVVQGADTTIIWGGYISSPSKVPIRSKILVERQFRAGSDTTIILQNKFPELAGAVLEAAKAYRWETFVPVTRPNEPPGQPRVLPHKRFLVEFTILHRIDECGLQ